MGQGGNQQWGGVSQATGSPGLSGSNVNPYAALGPNPYSWLGNWMGSQQPNYFGNNGGFGNKVAYAPGYQSPQVPNISQITGMTNRLNQTQNQVLNGPDMQGGPDITSLVQQVGNRQNAIGAAQGGMPQQNQVTSDYRLGPSGAWGGGYGSNRGK